MNFVRVSRYNDKRVYVRGRRACPEIARLRDLVISAFMISSLALAT